MRIRAAHASLQFSDTSKQHTHDIEKIFDRCVDRRIAWITGTEAGPGAGNISSELFRVGKEAGYRTWIPSAQKRGKGMHTDCWLAVRKDLVVSDWKTDFLPAIPGSAELYRRLKLDPIPEHPRWGPKGLVTASFMSLPEIGEVNIGVAHYLTKARHPDHSTVHGVNHWELNEDLAEVIGKWAREVGKGSALAFYAGDQNMADSRNREPQGDTFFGEKMTTLSDELKTWPNTGHGPIDVIATHNRDGRVSALSWRAFNDQQFFLHSDHFYTEGVIRVEPLGKK